MSDYPKFQYSYFLDNGAQIVVRSEDIDELVAGIDGAQEAYPPTTTQKTISRPTTAPQTGDLCKVHQRPLKSKVSKAGKPYKAHYRKLEDDSWDTCFGKGWLSEQQGQSSEEIAEALEREYANR